MMKYFAFLLVCVMAVAGFAHEHEHQDAKTAAMQCEIKEDHTCTIVHIPGAQCGMCVENIESAAKRVKGVTLAKVDLEKKVMHVHLDEKGSLQKVEKAISKAGYDANDTKRNENKHAKLPACCQSK